MGMIALKWYWIVLFILIVFLLLSVLGRKSVHQEIFINATAERVWEVLLDTDNYKDWNPTMELIEGKVEEGQKVKYRFTQDADNVSEIPSKVKQVVPNSLLNQGGGLPFILTFDHKYILEDSNGDTKLIIHEDYRGIWVHFWNPTPVEKAYGRLCSAIKEQSEKESR
ncbi:MAG: SRPBCC domain-containing protein [Bacteroidota bacterium]